MKNRAFTLIELLVVVLIISILTAVALPQYQKAVRKSYLADIGYRINTYEKMVDLYLLENGSSTTDVYLTGSNKVEIPVSLSCSEDGYWCGTKLCGWFVNARTNSNIVMDCRRGQTLGKQLFGDDFYLKIARISNGKWKVDRIMNGKADARKEVCLWWEGNYGADLMTNSAKSDCSL